MCSDESHFNVSLIIIVRDKVTRQCPQTTIYRAGIKMEGLLYLEKYGISGPEFGIKEEFVTEEGRQLFHARA